MREADPVVTLEKMKASKTIFACPASWSGLVFSGAGLLLGLGVGVSTSAALTPENVRVAEQKKTKAYLRDGLFVGGDAGVGDIIVRDIRRASNAGFERVVVDLGPGEDSKGTSAARAPYFQVAVSPGEKRLVFTVYGSPKLGFDPKKVVQGFEKSDLVRSIELFPRLEKDQWTFAVNLRAETPAEVFELADPLRVIIDLQSTGVASVKAKPVRMTAKKSPPLTRKTPSDPMADSLEKAEGLLQKELEEKLPSVQSPSHVDPMPGEGGH